MRTHPSTIVGALVGVVIVVVGTAAPTEAQIYTWRDADGALVLSDRPPTRDTQTVAVAGTRGVRTTRPLDPAIPTGRYDALIRRHASRHGVRPELIRAVIQVESGFDPDAISPAGAMGLMQLMPGTARELGIDNPFDPDANVAGGVTYLRQLLTRYGGREELALAAYNAGPGAVARFGNRIPPFPETLEYVHRVGASTSGGGPRPRADHGQTIYKGYETVNGRRIPRYTNVPTGTDDLDVAVPPSSR